MTSTFHLAPADQKRAFTSYREFKPRKPLATLRRQDLLTYLKKLVQEWHDKEASYGKDGTWSLAQACWERANELERLIVVLETWMPPPRQAKKRKRMPR
jgi:hypothetical protein